MGQTSGQEVSSSRAEPQKHCCRARGRDFSNPFCPFSSSSLPLGSFTARHLDEPHCHWTPTPHTSCGLAFSQLAWGSRGQGSRRVPGYPTLPSYGMKLGSARLYWLKY